MNTSALGCLLAASVVLQCHNAFGTQHSTTGKDVSIQRQLKHAAWSAQLLSYGAAVHSRPYHQAEWLLHSNTPVGRTCPLLCLTDSQEQLCYSFSEHVCHNGEGSLYMLTE